ncbi:unnamed protein product [Vitrella brassicaformis CCMP3155]|uniref:Uncharacterized protein n=2 Tax=Vitrella brassicaformis TaxID=1169539 RepID=A0A0G4EPS5_VITBC|nr:unnamed protein product [Vitrella brassicaformis CCMP3155]|mmetsp:Transcript_21682/g.53156  ORF Transcript_21682/g.53156 Transcript_21682/m.53156 type:complete len:255 (+) Transcript_21682:161-925(+)|eukprot:CEL99265.1 unnamed protein product [Vitrella brassicaformis CCMP3155]
MARSQLFAAVCLGAFLLVQQAECASNDVANVLRKKKGKHKGPPHADILDLGIKNGTSGGYVLKVRYTSTDKDCTQYMNWYELLDEEGRLLFKRHMTHPHTKFPIWRETLLPVDGVYDDTTVIVRGHMYPNGYSGKAIKGSIKDGFQPIDLPSDYAREAETGGPEAPECQEFVRGPRFNDKDQDNTDDTDDSTDDSTDSEDTSSEEADSQAQRGDATPGSKGDQKSGKKKNKKMTAEERAARKARIEEESLRTVG